MRILLPTLLGAFAATMAVPAWGQVELATGNPLRGNPVQQAVPAPAVTTSARPATALVTPASAEIDLDAAPAPPPSLVPPPEAKPAPPAARTGATAPRQTVQRAPVQRASFNYSPATAYLQNRQAMSRVHAPNMPRSVPQQQRSNYSTPPASKPFAYSSHRPTLSPYMNLYLEESEQAAPNYHTYVLPQLQQQQMLADQQSQLEGLSRQLQGRATAGASSGASPGVGGYQSRFLNTGGYFPSPTRSTGGLP